MVYFLSFQQSIVTEKHLFQHFSKAQISLYDVEE